MKQHLASLSLAMSIVLVSNAQALEAPNSFSVGLTQTRIDSGFDPADHCKKDCDTSQRLKSIEFWDNTITGGPEAAVDLALTASTQSASRFLMQSTYGPTALAVAELAAAIDAEGEDAALRRWISNQQSKLASQLTDLVHNQTDHLQTTAWWHQSLTADDQLRQRVAFALNHVQTISLNGALTKDGTLAAYYDVLANNAFGNFRDLLTDITFDIGMGVYLDNIHNAKADGTKSANENYARELMQLFSIGTEMLSINGKTKKKDGQPIPTYSEEDVASLARALTGFTRPGRWEGGLVLKDHRHDTDEKVLFAGTKQQKVLPAGQTAKQDVKDALDAIFDHPNVGPFIAKRLIQNLVTSNPSGGYIRRVAQTFNDNGLGKRGDMAAVVTAVLMDKEARNKGGKFYGKLKEPVLRMTNLLRGVEADLHSTTGTQIASVQRPLYADTVFSFFQPDDAPAGVIEQGNKVAPEFTLATDDRVAILHNAFYKNILEQGYSAKTLNKGQYNRLRLDREAVLAVNDPEALLDRYNLLFMGGSMRTSMKNAILKHLDTLPADDGEQRARHALYLVMASPQQAVQQ